MFSRIAFLNNSSTPGVNWRAISDTGVYTGIAAVGSVFALSRSGSGNSKYTTDGNTYNTIPTESFTNMFSIGSNLVSTDTSGGYKYSSNAVTWTARTSATSSATWVGAAAGSQMVLLGSAGQINRVFSITSGSWTNVTVSHSGTFKGLVYGGTTFVGVGSAGTDRIITGNNVATTWTSRSTNASHILEGVTYGNGLFVAVGTNSNNSILTSPDGITWTARVSAVDYVPLYGVAYGSNMFVAVGGDQIVTSPDGITWTKQTAPSGVANLRKVAYTNNRFVAVLGTGSGFFNITTSP